MTQKRFKIKKGDIVEVMVGKDRGRRGVVQKVFLDNGKILVDGVNKVMRFIRPSQTNPDGKIEKNLKIDISNVSLIDPSTDKPGRVGYSFDSAGKKTRVFKKTGSVINGNAF